MTAVQIASINATVANAIRNYAESANEVASIAASVVEKPKLLRTLLQKGNASGNKELETITTNIFKLQAAQDAEIGARAVLSETISSARLAAKQVLSEQDFTHYSSTLSRITSALESPYGGKLTVSSLRDEGIVSAATKGRGDDLFFNGLFGTLGGGFSGLAVGGVILDGTGANMGIGSAAGAILGIAAGTSMTLGFSAKNALARRASARARTPQELMTVLSDAAVHAADGTKMRAADGKNFTFGYAHELVKQTRLLADNARNRHAAASAAATHSPAQLNQAISDAQYAETIAKLRTSIISEHASQTADKHSSLSAAAQEIAAHAVTS